MAEAGVFQDGARSNCVKTYTGSGSYDRCVLVAWPIDYYAYARGSVRRAFWHGTVIEDKRDEANTYFRRNRSYDPAAGRFTQEDPIGLAGGLNLYGFAAGDPVSYSDPYGLCPKTLRFAPAALADGLLPFADATLVVVCVAELGVIGFRAYRTGRALEAVATASDRNGSATTEPTLPDREIVSEDGVTVEHYYRGDEHGPAHMHVNGGGPPTRIGPNGRPLRGDSELTRAQARVVNRNRSSIRRAGNKIGRWLEYKERMDGPK